MKRILAALVAVVLSSALFGAEPADPAAAPAPVWPPKGTPVKCPVTRDTYTSAYQSGKENETICNLGGENRLKVKGQQEHSLIDVDAAALKGKLITGALFHYKTQSPKEPWARLGISSVSSEWVEGNGEGYKPVPGAACYAQAEYQKRDWSFPGSTLVDVTFGRGQTLWKFAESTMPDADGWQTCAVDADVVAARMAGLSYGLAIWDEIGSEWSLKGGAFKFTYYPNRFIHSRHSKGSEPWLEVWTEGADTTPPEAVAGITVDADSFPAGEALVSWKTPKDAGGGHTLGFLVTYKADGAEKEMPRYLVPVAGAEGSDVRMHIQDLPFKDGQSVELTIKPVDSAGNVGAAFTKAVTLSAKPRAFAIAEAGLEPFPPSENLPAVGGLKVAVVDLLDKIHPVKGTVQPGQDAGYKGGNHLYSAEKKLVRLHAARNETVAFQINLEGEAKDIEVKVEFPGLDRLKPKLLEFGYVKAGVKPVGDPLTPLAGKFTIPRPDLKGQKNHSLVAELWVPHEEEPGAKKGKVTIAAGGETLELGVDLTVWNFTLPNKLSFVPEMNAYGTVAPGGNNAFYRVGHEHRTCVNRVPYNWGGGIAYAPKWNGNDYDWAEWDKTAGPLFDGSAFADMPRKNEPIDSFYLPFNETWPMDVHKHYKASYWADEAFTPEYKEGLKKAFAAFAKHCAEKKWNDTSLEFFLNNKVYNRATSPGNAAPWIFDEPCNTQDFWALRWYGLLWHEAVDPVRGEAKLWYRSDVSYSLFERNMFWGVLDKECFGGNNAEKTRQKHDELALWGKSYFTEYGSANDPKDPNTQPAVWCLLAWSRGADGVLPWQSIGDQGGWQKADPCCLFYPHASGPIPSVRLKAFTRGQQDVEYLTWLGVAYNQPRYAVAAGLAKLVDLEGKVNKTSETDAGTIEFKNADPTALWKMRVRVGKMVSDKGPAYRRSLVDWSNPKTDMAKLPDIGYVKTGPKVESFKPDCDQF